jgi:hypothetical protein
MWMVWNNIIYAGYWNKNGYINQIIKYYIIYINHIKYNKKRFICYYYC